MKQTEFCKTFIENGLKDPITGEFGKSLVLPFRKITLQNWLNYLMNTLINFFRINTKSDFAVQVTSNVQNAQQMTVDFSNDKLLGFSNFAKKRSIGKLQNQ